jgi:hypothetical protein
MIIGACLIAGLSLLFYAYLRFSISGRTPVYGATFSPSHAEYLGLDPQQVLDAAFEDLPLAFIRLPVLWNQVEQQPGQRDFSDVDAIMNQAARQHKHVILAVGNKVPRWPECHTPEWAKALPNEAYEQALLDYLEILVMRYHDHPALWRWQIENESLFRFGDCPNPNYGLLEREVALVKSLDTDHPVQLTVSGEQQLWASLAGLADVIGASMYRQVTLPNGFRFTFPIPAQVYRLQAFMVSAFVDKVVISELQAEPWLVKDYRDYTPEAAAELFTPRQLRRNLNYARASGLSEISLWGIEWWYYLRVHGYPELWESAGRSLR